MQKHFTPESELKQHLLAELFAKTAQMIREAHPWELEAIMLQHDNQLLAIANATALLLGRKNKEQPLVYGPRGYGFAVPPAAPGAADPGPETTADGGTGSTTIGSSPTPDK